MTFISNDPSFWLLITADRGYSYYVGSSKRLFNDDDASLHLYSSQSHPALHWYMIGVSQAPDIFRWND